MTLSSFAKQLQASIQAEKAAAQSEPTPAPEPVPEPAPEPEAGAHVEDNGVCRTCAEEFGSDDPGAWRAAQLRSYIAEHCPGETGGSAIPQLKKAEALRVVLQHLQHLVFEEELPKEKPRQVAPVSTMEAVSKPEAVQGSVEEVLSRLADRFEKSVRAVLSEGKELLLSPSPEQTQNGFDLYIDCIPMRERFTLLLDVLQPALEAASKVEAERDLKVEGVEYYNAFKYNRGPAFVAAQALRLKLYEKLKGAVVVRTTDGITSAVVEALKPKARNVVEGVK